MADAPKAEETKKAELAVPAKKVSTASTTASDSASSSDSGEIDKPPPAAAPAAAPPPKKTSKASDKKASLSSSGKQEATVSVGSEEEIVKKPPNQWTYRAIKKRIKQFEKPSLLHVCFFTINFVMFGLGMAGFSIGLLAINDRAALTGLVSDDSSNNRLSGVDFGGFMTKVATFMVPVGLVFITLGLLGAAGVATQDPKLLFGYAMFMGGLVAIEVLYVLYTMANWSSIEKEWVRDLKESMTTDYDGKVNSTKFFSQALDMAQYFFGCCGITSIDDFINTPWYKSENNFTSPSIPLANATTTKPTTLGATTNNASVNGTTPAHTTQKTTTEKPRKIVRFPKSCCKSQDNILTDLTNLESVKLVNIDCPIQNASARNPHTLDPCLGAVKKYMTSQVLVLVSLSFTLVGLQVSAVSNAQAMSDEIKEKIKKARREKKLAEEEDEDEGSSSKSSKAKRKKSGDKKPTKPRKPERSVDTGKSYSTAQEDSS